MAKECDISIIANTALGPGISGGDKIFIELARRWSKRGYKVSIFVWEGGLEMCRESRLEGVDYVVTPARTFQRFGFPVLYLVRTVLGCLKSLRHGFSRGKQVIYSASDFWPDTLPAFLIKRRRGDAIWVAGLYLIAPKPWRSASDLGYRGAYKSPTLRSILYYLTQKLSYGLIRRYADFVLVSNQLDREILERDGVPMERSMAVYGGVDTNAISRVAEREKRYDGCFVGRFHPQKGVLELIDIWEEVVSKKKDAKLAMIGIGPLDKEVREKVRERGLEGNIDLLGYLDGEEKYRILKSSRVFLHPPILDTGGMAAAEGMACGLPVVGFDLPGYKYCYPRGMLKAPVGDIKAFADLVLKLFEDRDLYARVQKEALEFIKEWDWDNRADQVLRAIETVASQR